MLFHPKTSHRIGETGYLCFLPPSTLRTVALLSFNTEYSSKGLNLTDKNQHIRAVVFDMDGLMFNTEDIYDVVGSELLKDRGHEFTRELKQKMMGLPGHKAFEVMKSHCNLLDDVEVLKNESESIFRELLPKRIEMLPGLSFLLQELERRELAKAVATSSQRQFAEMALSSFELMPRFEFILTAEDVENGKPAPDIYLEASRRLGVEMSNVLVLEDSFIGSTAAANSGALTVAIPGAHSAEQNFDHVDYVVDRLDSEVILMLLNR